MAHWCDFLWRWCQANFLSCIMLYLLTQIKWLWLKIAEYWQISNWDMFYWNEWINEFPSVTYRLNWTRRTSWGLWVKQTNLQASTWRAFDAWITASVIILSQYVYNTSRYFVACVRKTLQIDAYFLYLFAQARHSMTLIQFQSSV